MDQSGEAGTVEEQPKMQPEAVTAGSSHDSVYSHVTIFVSCGCHQVSETGQETMCWAERVEHTKCKATVGNENTFVPGQSYLNLL